MGMFLNNLSYHWNNVKYRKEFKEATTGSSSKSTKKSEDKLWSKAVEKATQLSSNVKTAISSLLDNDISILAATSTAVKSLSLVYYTVFWIKDIENLDPKEFEDASSKEFCNAIAELCGFSSMYETVGKSILSPYSIDSDEFSIDGLFIIDMQQILSIINEDVKKAAVEKIEFKTAASEAPTEDSEDEPDEYTTDGNIIRPVKFVNNDNLNIELDENGNPKSSDSEQESTEETKEQPQPEIILSSIRSSNILQELFPEGFEVKYNSLFGCITLTVHEEDYKLDVIDGNIYVTAPIQDKNGDSVITWIGTDIGKKILSNYRYHVTEKDLAYYPTDTYKIVLSNIFITSDNTDTNS